MHPVHRQAPVQEAGVGGTLGEDLRRLEKAPDSQLVVHGEGDDGLYQGLRSVVDAAEVVLRIGGGASVEAVAEDPD